MLFVMIVCQEHAQGPWAPTQKPVQLSPESEGNSIQSLGASEIGYYASVWDPYKQDHKNRLEAVQRRAARFVCKDSRRTSSVSTMITKLGWKPLENRWTVSRLSLLFKSIHHTVAINTDKHLTSQADNKICTRKSL